MVKNPIISDIRKRFLKTTDLKAFRGFTLAEVLITLVIIGVIASMTIPTLMNNTNKQEYVSRLTKAYSTLNQGLNSIWQNNGVSPGDYEFINTIDFIDEFSKVVAVQNKCNNFSGCLGGSFASKYKFLNNNTASGVTDGKTVITSDGQMYSFTNAAYIFYGISAEDSDNVMGRLIVDVNGAKKPNKFGIDTFTFYLVRGKGFIPAGMEDYSKCNTTQKGYECTAKVLKEKAINYT